MLNAGGEKMSKKLVIVLTVLILIGAGSVAAGYFIFSNEGPYSGTVTLAESGEPVAGVSVTDGRNVVKTDENGEFTLQGWRKTRFITVTVPAGYWT